MRNLSDRAFILYASAVVVVVGGLTLLYPSGPHPPGLDHGFIRFSLLLVIALVAVVRLHGSIVGIIAAALLGVAGIVSLGWITGLAPPDPDAMVDLFTVALVGGGLGVYVGIMGRQAEAALVGEQQQAVVLDMSVDLVPKALDPDALARMLDAVEAAAGAARVAMLVKVDGVMAEVPAPRSRTEDVGESPVAVARLMLDSYVDTDSQGVASEPVIPESLVTARSEVFVPILSSDGIEGVLFARREDESRRWNSREVDFLTFAANLIGALTERERLQTQVSHAEAMEEADRLKANLLLSVSHDLKTPIAAATASLTSVIDQGGADLDEGTAAELHSVKEDLIVLDERVTELIDVARLETASWNTNIDYNDVADLCHLVRATIGDRGAGRLSCPDMRDVPPFRFDITQVGRALIHIVQNALLYSPDDTPVQIAIAYDDREVRISVEDQGPGLSEEDQAHLFDKFYRGSASDGIPYGTGLGLCIAEKIISGHGGRIEVENVTPTGSRFTVVLPRGEEESS